MASGRYGQVASGITAIATVENWNLNDTKTADSYVASNTAIGTDRGGGVRDWNVSFSGRGAKPPIMPNDVFTFTGYTAPDDGTQGGSGPIYSGNAICESLEITYDWTANGLIAWSATCQGKPGLTIADGTPAVDNTVPTKEIACGTYLAYWNNTDQWIEFPKLTGLTLTFTSALTTEVNSSTRANNECWIDREPGPIDWTLSAPQDDYERDTPYLDLGDDNMLRLYTKGDLSEWFDLVFGRQESYDGLDITLAGGDPINRTMNFSMQAITEKGVFGAQQKGFISLPGSPTTAWWGTYFDPETIIP